MKVFIATDGSEYSRAAVETLMRLPLPQTVEATVCTVTPKLTPIDVEHEGDRIRLDFDAREGGYLVISEVWYPGWQARVDGRVREIERANGFFQALEVGPGRHEIVLEYWPVSLRVGLWISGLGLALLFTLLALGAWPRVHRSRRHRDGRRLTEIAAQAQPAD